jgi:RecB family endonuclease NucS
MSVISPGIIRTDRGFVLYAYCTVEYKGRAVSTVGPVNVCILHKPDGTLLIHGSANCGPMNYQRPKSSLTLEGNNLICVSSKRDESIIIDLISIKHYHELSDWSNDKIKLKGTEKQLCESIIANINEYIDIIPVEIHRELRTKYGPIDIAIIDEKGAYHLIEVKRAKVTVSTLFQVNKYKSCFDVACGYVAAPEISPKAEVMLEEFGLAYLAVQHTQI